MVAGVVIIYMRAFQIGDRVKIADAVGDVVEKILFVIRVRTIKNVGITIPNAMVLSNHIINFSTLSKRDGLILHATVTLGYDVDWRKVHELLIKAARATKMIEPHPEPYVFQTSLDDFYVTYEINASTKHPKEMSEIYSELRQNILDCFHEAGVEITSPHYAALRDGNPAAIPDEHLPRDYNPPGPAVREVFID
jgi:small-conductance mechanosensitive channel